MLRLAITFVLLLLMLFGGAVWLLDLSPELQAPEKQAKERSEPKTGTANKSSSDELQEALKPAAKSANAPAFDVARINPNGTSVFAGRAEPKSLVTITVDGKEIGTAAADENGDWILTTDTKIANPDGKLALFKAPPGAVPGVAGSAPQQTAAKSAASSPKTASAVTSTMLKSLQGMVEAARTGEEKPAPTAAATPPIDAAANAPVAAPSPATPAVSAPPQSTTVPVPVTFLYNEATLTSDGRKAAALLLEYLQLKRFPSITLTGHADERGSDDLNMALSRERLDTVASFLRDGGYRGQLNLVAKGKSEPYTGVVRGDFSQEDLWQLDRRVELVVSR